MNVSELKKHINIIINRNKSYLEDIESNKISDYDVKDYLIWKTILSGGLTEEEIFWATAKMYYDDELKTLNEKQQRSLLFGISSHALAYKMKRINEKIRVLCIQYSKSLPLQ